MEFCRSCGSPLPTPFLDPGNTPLSNGYLSEKIIYVMEPYYLIELYCCSDYLVMLHIKEDIIRHCSLIRAWLNDFLIIFSNRGVIL